MAFGGDAFGGSDYGFGTNVTSGRGGLGGGSTPDNDSGGSQATDEGGSYGNESYGGYSTPDVSGYGGYSTPDVSNGKFAGRSVPTPQLGPRQAQGDLARISYSLQGLRRDPLDPDLERAIRQHVAKMGPGYYVSVFSAGQKSNKKGEGKGSTRHNAGFAADVQVFDPTGKQVVGNNLNGFLNSMATAGYNVAPGMKSLNGTHIGFHPDRVRTWQDAKGYPNQTPGNVSAIEAGIKASNMTPEVSLFAASDIPTPREDPRTGFASVADIASLDVQNTPISIATPARATQTIDAETYAQAAPDIATPGLALTEDEIDLDYQYTGLHNVPTPRNRGVSGLGPDAVDPTVTAFAEAPDPRSLFAGRTVPTPRQAPGAPDNSLLAGRTVPTPQLGPRQAQVAPDPRSLFAGRTVPTPQLGPRQTQDIAQGIQTARVATTQPTRTAQVSEPDQRYNELRQPDAIERAPLDPIETASPPVQTAAKKAATAPGGWRSKLSAFSAAMVTVGKNAVAKVTDDMAVSLEAAAPGIRDMVVSDYLSRMAYQQESIFHEMNPNLYQAPTHVPTGVTVAETPRAAPAPTAPSMENGWGAFTLSSFEVENDPNLAAGQGKVVGMTQDGRPVVYSGVKAA